MTQPAHLQWLEIAERDLGVAKHLFEIYRPMPLEIICYQCQQCAEKALKALYIFLKIPGGVPKTHDLSMLLDQMHNSVDIADSYFDLADRLTPFGTAARYPSNMYFDEYNTGKAIEAAGTILNWVKQQLQEK